MVDRSCLVIKFKSKFNRSRYFTRRLAGLSALLLLVLTPLILAVPSTTEAKTNDEIDASGPRDAEGGVESNNIDPSVTLLPWQRCSIFVAPTLASKNNNDNNGKVGMNWGVYANRDFLEGEIVDISPLTVPIHDGSVAIERSVLNDYVYGYWRLFEHPQIKGKHTISKLYSVLFGPDMIYNHHPHTPNVAFTTFGREPEMNLPNAVNPQGFVANRKIKRGEELFSSYNGKEDGGAEWFGRRGIPMETPSSPAASVMTTNAGGILDKHARDYCSKIYSGVGWPSWKDRLLPLLPKDYKIPFSIDLIWLAPSFDAGWGDARTKIGVRKGERLEISTALVLSQEFTKHTALMPLVYAWKDLHEDHREGLVRLARKSLLHLQYQGPDTSWKPTNNFMDPKSFEDLLLFPVAGNIGMVRRLHTNVDDSSKVTDANCRLVVHPRRDQDENNYDNDSMQWLDHPVGVTIELVATKDMDAGTVLVIDLVESVASPYEYKLLLEELKQTGQPFSRQVFMDRFHRTKAGEEWSRATTRSWSKEEL